MAMEGEMTALIDLTGRRFGHWTVENRIGNRGSDALWACRCDCGVSRAVYGINLRYRRSRSCGCRGIGRSPLNPTRHGRSATPEYRTWRNMRDRCHNSNAQGYGAYGARGIVVCDIWDLDLGRDILWIASTITVDTARRIADGRRILSRYAIGAATEYLRSMEKR